MQKKWKDKELMEKRIKAKPRKKFFFPRQGSSKNVNNE